MEVVSVEIRKKADVETGNLVALAVLFKVGRLEFEAGVGEHILELIEHLLTTLGHVDNEHLGLILVGHHLLFSFNLFITK